MKWAYAKLQVAQVLEASVGEKKQFIEKLNFQWQLIILFPMEVREC